MNKLLRITGCGNYLHCFYISGTLNYNVWWWGNKDLAYAAVFFFFSTSINLFIYVDYHKLIS